MSTENNETKKNWLDKLTERFNALMTKFDMPEDIRHELESFVLAVAKEQYMSGNKGGIAWLRKQLGAKPGQLLTAANVTPQTA